MLIPFINTDPSVAAEEVPNGYVNKLITESLQMMTGAVWHHQPEETRGKLPGYGNHPFTVWIAHSKWAWDWLYCFACALAEREYPKRYPEKIARRKRKKESLTHKSWDKIQELEVPSEFEFATMSETPLCPLPKAAKGLPNVCTHTQRAGEFREYLKTCKNKDMWQFLWEPRTRRPAWMPERNAAQNAIVERHHKKLKLGPK